MLYVPVAFLLVSTFTSLVQSIIGCVSALSASGAAVIATSGLQLVFAILLVVLGLIVAYNCLKELFGKSAGSLPDEEPEWSELGREELRPVAPCRGALAAPVVPGTAGPFLVAGPASGPRIEPCRVAESGVVAACGRGALRDLGSWQRLPLP